MHLSPTNVRNPKVIPGEVSFALTKSQLREAVRDYFEKNKTTMKKRISKNSIEIKYDFNITNIHKSPVIAYYEF